MLPEIELLNISKDIQVDNKDVFGDTVVEWLLDVDHKRRFKHECSSPAAESSSADTSASSSVLKEEDTPQEKVTKKKPFKYRYISICTAEVHQIESNNDEKTGKQKANEHQDTLLPSLRVTKEPLRCQWSTQKMKRCGRCFNTAEALTGHVLGEHAKGAQQAEDGSGKTCNWGICKAKASDLRKHTMEEHLAIHIFACPFEKCRTVGGPPKSFSALKAHVKKYHSMREKMRPLFMPVDAAMSGPSRLEKLPNPVPFYKLGQPLIHSKRRKASATSDNDQTAIDQLTPSFSQEARRPRAEPWKDKDYTRIQDGTRLRDAYALDDGRRLGIHDTWEVSLANVVPLNTSTSAGDRPKKQHRPDHRGRR